ncbi:unnamed protein product [Dicrocoelium dendriticum]|nr:unnamed protein product [Dicrocoelium dendriticum]
MDRLVAYFPVLHENSIQKIDTVLKSAVGVPGSVLAQPNSFDNCQSTSTTPILTELAELRREVRRLQLPDSCSRCRASISATRAELNQLRDDLEQLKIPDRLE